MSTTPASYKCPECNAALSVDAGAVVVKCRYCGASVKVARTLTGSERPRLPAPAAASEPTRRGPAGAIFTVALMLAAAGGVTAWRLGRHGDSGGVFEGTFQWDPSAADGPWAGRVNDDGIEDVVGGYRTLRSGGGGDQFVGAWDGATFRRLWSVGPLGEMSNSRYVRFAVSGRRLLATDDKQTARIFDLATGKPIGSVALSDHAERLCGAPEAPARFWIESADRSSKLIDGERATGSDGARPSWCVLAPPNAYNTRLMFARMHEDIRHNRLSEREPTSVPGFHAEFSVLDGGDGVVVGAKSPGTAHAMAVGFDPSTRAVRWSRVLSPSPGQTQSGAPGAAGLGHGKLVTFYKPLAGDTRLVALDAATGALRFDVGLPGSAHFGPDWFVVSETRVYVAAGILLYVLDGKSGAVLGEIGQRM